LVAPARLADGTEVVVKVQLPDDFESIREAEALRFWDGHGAVRLLAHDPERKALLLERCLPGTPLGTAYDEEALGIAARLMERLWREPPPEVDWPQLDDVAARWARELAQRYPGRIAEEAVEAIAVLTPIEDAVLCHQDLHGGNILRAEREPWLAIDPKPILAERAYDTVAIVRDAQPALAELGRRLDALSELLGLDRERMRLWGLVKSLAWDDPEEAQLFSEVGSR
jgi:streptomycin 6-kinase